VVGDCGPEGILLQKPYATEISGKAVVGLLIMAPNSCLGTHSDFRLSIEDVLRGGQLSTANATGREKVIPTGNIFNLSPRLWLGRQFHHRLDPFLPGIWEKSAGCVETARRIPRRQKTFSGNSPLNVSREVDTKTEEFGPVFRK